MEPGILRRSGRPGAELLRGFWRLRRPELVHHLASCPVSEQEPYLYQDSSGNYDVFVPSVQSNTSGPTWTASSNTPGTSLSVNNTFYVVNSASTITQINAALAAGDNLLFTPGVYSYGSTINVVDPNTKIIGLGFATLIPTSGNVTMNVADVPGVNISGLIFDAGPVNSPALLQSVPPALPPTTPPTRSASTTSPSASAARRPARPPPASSTTATTGSSTTSGPGAPTTAPAWAGPPTPPPAA